MLVPGFELQAASACWKAAIEASSPSPGSPAELTRHSTLPLVEAEPADRGAVGEGQRVLLGERREEVLGDAAHVRRRRGRRPGIRGAVGDPAGEPVEVADGVPPLGRRARGADLVRLREVAQGEGDAVDRPLVKGAEHQVQDAVGAVRSGEQEEDRLLAGGELRRAPDLEPQPGRRIDPARHAHHDGAAGDVPLEHPLDLDEVVGGDRAGERRRAGADDAGLHHHRRLVAQGGVGHLLVRGGGGRPAQRKGEGQSEETERNPGMQLHQSLQESTTLWRSEEPLLNAQVVHSKVSMIIPEAMPTASPPREFFSRGGKRLPGVVGGGSLRRVAGGTGRARRARRRGA